MKHVVWLLAVPAVALGAWFVVPCGAGAVQAGDGKPAAGDSKDGDVALAVGSVPAAALAAATAKLPGITFTSAEREVERGVTLYSLVGSVNGRRYEVEVTADGKVVEVEDECDEDEDGDDEDDDQDD